METSGCLRSDQHESKDLLCSTFHVQVEKRKEVKISYTSKVVLQHEPRHNNTVGDTTNEEVTSYMNKTKRSTRCVTSFIYSCCEY